MKIAFIGLRGIPANYGGFETFAEELAPRLVDRGHQVTVYGRSNNIDYAAPFYKGVRIKVLPTISHKYLDTLVHTLLASVHCSLKGGYDVILMVNAANAPFAIFPRIARIPVALNVDGIERLRKKWGRPGQILYRIGEWMATRIPNQIVADAQVIAQYYDETYGQDSEIIAYGANTDATPAGETLQRLNLKPENYVLYVSRLERENNADKVIKAFKSVETECPLVVVGDAPYSDEYKAELVALAASDERVILAGGIYGNGYRELISNACVYVQATEVGGTHPALLEAMATGNCVVANHVAEHEEVLGDCGVLYKFNDTGDLAEQLRSVLSDKDKRETCARMARMRIAENYTWDVIAEKYEALLSRVAGKASDLRAESSAGQILQ